MKEKEIWKEKAIWTVKVPIELHLLMTTESGMIEPTSLEIESEVKKAISDIEHTYFIRKEEIKLSYKYSEDAQ